MFYYDRGHPAGFTDDLGIIADRNQWVDERLAGWYTNITKAQSTEIFDWCSKNLKHYWNSRVRLTGYELYLSSHKEVTMFILRFS